MSFKVFKKNIKYLCSHLLSKDILTVDILNDNIEEAVIESFGSQLYPNILNVSETLDMLISTNKSFVRFGDGEIELMSGKDIPFQTASFELSTMLKEVLCSNDDTIAIGIPGFIYKSKEKLNAIPRNFWRKTGGRFRKQIAPYFSNIRTYYAAETTIACDAYQDFNKQEFFDKFRKIWKDKDITIICGKTVFDKIEHNIFDNAQSVEYIYAPPLNAFETYNDILKHALHIDKSRLVILILGPTAKVLVYDLAKSGFRALDLGHIAKSYDWYKCGRTTINMSDAVEFFNPD